MIDCNYKEFCQMRKTVSKRIKAYVEKNLQEEKEKLIKLEKNFLYEQDKYKQAEFTLKYLETYNLDNEFFNRARRSANEYLSYHSNDLEKYNSDKNSLLNHIKEYEFGLNNWKENYKEEFDYVSSLPQNINLFVKPVKWNHPYGLFITIEKDYSDSFEFNRTWKDDYHFTDGDYILMNDFLGFMKSKKFQGHLKKD